MTTTLDTRVAPPSAKRSRWIEDWDPENPAFWEATGKKVARRNLVFSILAEHIGFSVWTMWASLVLFLGPKYGFTPADKFLLTTTPALVGCLVRVPYTFAVLEVVPGSISRFMDEAKLPPPTPARAPTIISVPRDTPGSRTNSVDTRGMSSRSALTTVQLRPPNFATAKV